MTNTEHIGGCYFVSCEVDGQMARVCLLDKPDTIAPVMKAITNRTDLIRQYATDLCVLQQRLKELTEQ